MGYDVRNAFSGEPSSPYVAYLQDSQQPLNALIFLSPVLALYHLGIWFMQSLDLQVANGADVMLAEILNLVYFVGLAVLRYLTPELTEADSAAVWFLRTFSSLFALFLLIFFLLLQQHLCDSKWRCKPALFVWIFLESTLFALPLFALEWLVKYIAEYGTVPLMADVGGKIDGWAAGLVLSMGAGVYEEFLFRLLLMGLLFQVGGRLFSLKGTPLYVSAMLTQAILFTAFHYLPWSHETFAMPAAVFRLIAGLYFGYLYQERGFAVAAGGHVIYDVLAVSI